MDMQELLGLDSGSFRDKDVSVSEILEWFKTCDAFWMHSGDSKDPHAKLTSGKCSNGFFDCLRVLKYINLSEILANQLARKIRNDFNGIGDQKVDWVIASPMAGITFGHDVARALGAKIFMFTEKDPEIKGRMLWRRMNIPEGDSVLQIEELTTTSGTLNAVQTAIEEGNQDPVNWLPVIGILVHRPPKLPIPSYGDRRVVALIEEAIWAVEQEKCTLCPESARYLPKTNWEKLTGKK